MENRKKQSNQKQSNQKKIANRDRKSVRQPQNRLDAGGKSREKSGKANAVKPGECRYLKKCGGCQAVGTPYDQQIEEKQKRMNKLLSPFGKVAPFVRMDQPMHYRHKVHAVFDCTKRGQVIAGCYEKKSHDVVDIDQCLIENEKADAIIQEIKGMLHSFRIKTYDEDTGYGLLRHVLVRVGYHTGEIMVVLVCGSPVFPSKNNFVKVLRGKFPEITTVVLNVNDKRTSMVLGERNITLYGKGFIEDQLCGCTFRISPNSFYQVNPQMTELLYEKAIACGGLTGKENVIDAYCGTGTIGLIAAQKAGRVIGVELNRDAVRDAVTNAKKNQISNITFINEDATEYLVKQAAEGKQADVIFMDPPRSGSTPEFLAAAVAMKPSRIVYVSCGPDTLARDLKLLISEGYQVKEMTPFDCFPMTEHVECVVLLSRV